MRHWGWVLVLMLGLASCTANAGTEPARQTGVAHWSGTTYAAKSRATELGSAGYTARGDFSFQVDGDGNVTGHAVVVYQPSADFGILNQKIGIARSMGSAVAGTLGLPGIIPNAAIQTVVGVTVAWPDPLPTRHGPIKGSLAAGVLSLEWATEQNAELPATVSLVYLNRSEVLSTTPLSLGTPWPESAAVADSGGQLMAVSSANKQTTEDGVVITDAWTWTARRTV
ncbi:hypothetical protein GCM10010171_32790 [Actinokineospora fastidiosa]|uniref:Uncharacterized protein n=1 Tax=Actinokineospora fastidiosa TaxID=1816 RepID=A0A918LEK4_9PSEU|nr:hypothetical protein GCM10010171_32790 [Actinokineospora fastidiosa]